MERSLYERDRTGVQDAVMLEDYTNDRAFVDNLKKRFHENLVYVSKPSAKQKQHPGMQSHWLVCWTERGAGMGRGGGVSLNSAVIQ